jgi:predicted lipoprotein
MAMRRRGLLGLGLTAGLLPHLARAQDASARPPLTLLDTVFAPTAEAYGRSLNRLADTLREGCTVPERRQEMVQTFAGVMTAWGRLQPLIQGPLGDVVLASRIAYWPDKHGTGGRQLGAALKSRDAALTDPAALAQKSAAVSGLPALERLLFPDDGGGDAAARSYACAYAAALVQVQKDRAVQAGAVFARGRRDPEPVFQGAFASMRDGLDFMLRLKLEDPMGSEPGAARGSRAELWRSGSSLAVIDANLTIFQAVMTDPAGIGQRLDLGPESAAAAAIIGHRLADARQAVAAIPMPLHKAVEDPAARPAVVELARQIRELRSRVVDRLGPALGVTSGFNAMDGD